MLLIIFLAVCFIESAVWHLNPNEMNHKFFNRIQDFLFSLPFKQFEYRIMLGLFLVISLKYNDNDDKWRTVFIIN